MRTIEAGQRLRAGPSRKQPIGASPIGAAPATRVVSAETLKSRISTFVFDECMKPGVTAGIHRRRIQEQMQNDLGNTSELEHFLNDMLSTGQLCYGKDRHHYHVCNVWDWDEDLEIDDYDLGWE